MKNPYTGMKMSIMGNWTDIMLRGGSLMSDESKKCLLGKKKHLQEFINRSVQMYNMIPYVQKELEYTDFELDVLNNCPEEIKSYFELNSNYYKEDFSFVKKKFVLPKDYSTSSYFVPATPTLTMSVVEKVGTEHPEKTSWAKSIKVRYNHIIESESTRDLITKGIKELNTSLIALFINGENDFDKYLAGAIDKKKAAISLRTCLEKVTGEILFRAKRSPKEKNISLAEAFCRTTILPQDSHKFEQLISLAKDYKTGLYSDVSNIIHDRNKPKNLEDVHVSYIDFLSTSIAALF